jgi:Ni/Co efflux regulator RcnB
MKSTLVRLLALATLATSMSMSAFAATEKSKGDETVNASAPTAQQSNCDKKQKKEKKSHEETQEEKDFDRLLMGTHG